MRLEAWITAAWLVSAATAKNPPRLKGSPEKIKDWKWPNPFNSTRLGKYEATCEVERTFAAEEYVLDDLSVNPPTGLLPYRDALKSVFSSREYPGSWDGIDPHGYDRTLLTMTYADMPLKVREWIEDQERTNGPGKGLFAVYQRPMPGTRVLNTIKVPDAPVPDEWRERDERRIALFAPGALYEMLPLWVAEGSMCEDSLLDVSRYSAKPTDGGVIAYPVHYTWPKRSQHERDIEFRVKAQVLKLKPGEEETEEEVEETQQEEEKTVEQAGENTKTEKTEEAEKEEKKEKPQDADEEKSAGKDEL